MVSQPEDPTATQGLTSVAEQTDLTKKMLHPDSVKSEKVYELLIAVVPAVGKGVPTIKLGITVTSQEVAVPFSVHVKSTVVAVRDDRIKFEGAGHWVKPLKKVVKISKVIIFFIMFIF